MNSKGISPVIATVLLVLVAVALVMVLLPFLMSTTQETTAKTGEDLKGLGGSFAIKTCTRSGTTITLLLDNTGTTDLNNFTVNCLDSTGATKATATISFDVLSPKETDTKTATCTATTTRVRVTSVEYPKIYAERDCTS
ncbi:MAG: hypothetical protein N3F05_00695 [Candidatus Diapherotrites archaeon]|nr:hypothetical protein [Candidatus Diapherotrites archaeon]